MTIAPPTPKFKVGRGSLLGAIVRAHPGAQGTLFDQAHVVRRPLALTAQLAFSPSQEDTRAWSLRNGPHPETNGGPRWC